MKKSIAGNQRVAILVEMEAAFAILGCIAVLRHLLVARYPAVVWTVFAILALFAAAWIASMLRK